MSNLKDRLSLSGPLADSVRSRIENSLKKAKIKLQTTRELAGLSISSDTSVDLGSFSDSDVSISPIRTTSRKSDSPKPNLPDRKALGTPKIEPTPSTRYNLRPRNTPSTIPTPQPRLSKGQTPDIEYDQSLEWDNFDLQLAGPSTPVGLPSTSSADKKDHVRKWLEENSDKPHVVTRSGRVVKPRVIFDPADEADREKALKEARRQHISSQPSGIKTERLEEASKASPAHSSDAENQTRSLRSKATKGIAIKSSRGKSSK